MGNLSADCSPMTLTITQMINELTLKTTSMHRKDIPLSFVIQVMQKTCETNVLVKTCGKSGTLE